MRGSILIAVVFGATSFLTPTEAVQAQEDEPQGRFVTVTSFSVPYHHRGPVVDHIRHRIWPATQLNPNVKNARILVHRWGSDADQILMVREYDDWASIEAACEPCQEWYDNNPPPQEGEEGHDEFQRGLELWQQYYSEHRDEIYWAPMEAATIEGEVMGEVGFPEEEEEQP